MRSSAAHGISAPNHFLFCTYDECADVVPSSILEGHTAKSQFVNKTCKPPGHPSAMPRTRLPAHPSPDVQSWVDNIHLTALERRRRGQELSQTSSGSHSDSNISVPPVARRSPGHSVDQSSQDDTSVTDIDSAAHNPAETLHTPVSATVSLHPRSQQSNSANVGLGRRSSGLLPNNKSLLQLKMAGILPELSPSHNSSSKSESTERSNALLAPLHR